MNLWFNRIMQSNRQILIPSLLVLTLIFSGCDDPQSLIKSAQTEIFVTMITEGCEEEEWVVPSESPITVTIDNQTGVERQWMVMSRPVTPPFDPADEERVFIILSAPQGKSEQVFNAPAMPGQYQVFCGKAGEVDPAMRARLVVVRP